MRIRTIKPEFYQSEELARVPRQARLLAAALITWADDEGHFRSHPALIAGALFPFDLDGKGFVETGLVELASIGFVQLFEGGVGRLPGFERHQVINRPSESRLKHKALKLQDSVRTHGGLSEDSRTEVELGREVEREVEQGTSTEVVEPVPHPLQAVWNEPRAPSMPRWSKTEGARLTHANARLRDHELDVWADVVKRLAASDFASGRGGKWAATPDWLVKAPGNAIKVLEGHYDNRQAPPGASNRAPAPVADWSTVTPGEVSL